MMSSYTAGRVLDSVQAKNTVDDCQLALPMGDHDECPAPQSPGYRLQEQAGRPVVEAFRGLIQDVDRGVPEQGSSESDALHLSR